MGIFGDSKTQFDTLVEKVTDEKNTNEDWGLIMSVCDRFVILEYTWITLKHLSKQLNILSRVGATNTGPKECLKALVKRLNHPDPHVVVQVRWGGFLFWESFKCTLNMNYLPKISKVSGSPTGISGDHFAWCLRQQLWKILFAWGPFCWRPIYFNILSTRSPVENLRQSFASFWGSLIPKWQKNWKLCWKGERETRMWWNRIFWKH